MINSNTNLPIPLKEKEDSLSSSSLSISEKSIKSPSPRVSKSPSPPPQEPIKSPSPPPSESIKIPPQEPISTPMIEQKQSHSSLTNNDYDEDFSENSHSPLNTSTKVKIDDIDIESINEDLDIKPSVHETNQSSTSKSTADEQSEILVLNKKSANNTPRQQDDKTIEEEFLPHPAPPPSTPFPPKIELDDTSHDISEGDDVHDTVVQQNPVDKLAETLIRTFIDEAIDQGKEIEDLKNKNLLTKEASEWMSDEDLTDEETNRQTPTNHEEDIDVE